MDRFLRSLLTSSAGDSVNTDKSLSEIARSVLVDKTDGDAKTFREKAGLLALLNLLGIVEAFYGALPSSEGGAPAGQLAVHDPAVEALARTAVSPPAAPEPAPAPAPAVPEGPISIVSTLTKLMGSASTAQPGTSPIANLLSSLDPSMIASMLGMVAAMAKARPAKPPAKVEAQDSDDVPDESGTSQAEPNPSPEPAPPSPLQQLLGVDPKVLTLILNVLAEFMKSKAAEPKEKPAVAKPNADARADGAPAVEAHAHQPAARRTLSRLHKPGLGIYRAPCAPAKPQVRPQGI